MTIQLRNYLALFLAGLCVAIPRTGYSQTYATVVDISPSATQVTEQIPPAPARIGMYGWQGSAGTTYSIRFSIAAQPALVVGIGTHIDSTSYDASASTLTVTTTYNGQVILADSAIELPDNSFLIAIDPGIDGSLLPFRKAAHAYRIARATSSSEQCYGPGADPAIYRDETNDFGDDTSLNDPPVTSSDNETIGFPLEAAGTTASTNTFYWCVVPPSGTTQAAGFRLSGAKGKTSILSMSLSQGLLDFMGDKVDRTLSASNLAIFSGDIQVSTAVVASSNGADVSLEAPLNSSSTDVSTTSASLAAAARATRAATSTALETRSLKVGVREAVSIDPENLTVRGNSVSFSGSVEDPDLIGEFVEILRIGRVGKCGISVSATTTGTVIARGVIKSDGSYNVKLPASAIFNKNGSRANLQARISGSTTQQSRQISLANRNRNARQ